MNKKIIFIADYFTEHVLGGGELNNEELIIILQESGYDVLKVQSHLVTLDFLKRHKDDFFIVANFVNLYEHNKEFLKKTSYIIYEHDHKYLRSRNPATYKNFKAPERDILNYHFYKNAKAVACQSSFHKDIMSKNLNLDNIISLGGNLWSKSSLNKIRELSKKEKKDRYSIMNSQIPHKNTQGTINYCRYKSLDFELISSPDYFTFLEKLGSNKNFIFLPKTPETLSRVVVEARMMGCSVIVNNLIGASGEPWFEMKGEPLIDYMIGKKSEIFSIITKYVDESQSRPSKPLVSIITTFHEGEKYLNNFMKNITDQDHYEDYELIIVDAASQGSEQKTIQEFCKEKDNIVYIRLEEKTAITPCLNLAIREAKSDFITFAFLDDVKRPDCIQTLYNNIINQDDIDLVYGDVAQTIKENQTFDKATKENLFEHSQFSFSKENMIKCLPGPMPLWRKKIHDRCGFFDSDRCNYADDWEMWLRAVESGSKFKKVNEVVGLYLAGGRSQRNVPEQRTEESEIFFKYKHIFGSNYQKFKPYFEQFKEKINGKEKISSDTFGTN
jgi:GT2 family glycosyltransferase|tara:strand:- start:30207 stop:31874 length:1668 start_codon:yes stop_codon:yes gene_type:complete